MANIPEDFVSVVSDSARDNIRKLIKANIGEVEPLGDQECRRQDGNLRCPLGACLPPSKVVFFSIIPLWIIFLLFAREK